MTDRDTFAAAALTGLLAQGDDGSFSEESYVRAAYRWADAMIAVRDSRTAQPSPQPTLTDDEREAVEWYAAYGRGDHAVTLRKLLARLA